MKKAMQWLYDNWMKATPFLAVYSATDGTLFSTVAKTLKECRQRRDEWLNKKINNSK